MVAARAAGRALVARRYGVTRVRLALSVDVRRCIGCAACAVACRAEFDVPEGAARLIVRRLQTENYPQSRERPLPVMCNHCDAAPCVPVCPTGALGRRPDGIVDLDKSKCTACGECLGACPFDALFWNPVTRTADKCSLCAHRVDEGLEPACVPVCPTEALRIFDLDDPPSAQTLASLGPATVRKPDRGAAPHVFYVGSDEALTASHAGASPPATGPYGPLRRAGGRKGEPW